jgi:hypothetical protein
LFQVGEAFDGSFGSNDGVGYLEGQSICVNAVSANIPPIAMGFPIGNSLNLACGETLDRRLTFLSPEVDQLTTVLVKNVPLWVKVTNTPGNSALIMLSGVADIPGTFTLTFSSTNNVSNPSMTVQTLSIETTCTPELTPEPTPELMPRPTPEMCYEDVPFEDPKYECHCDCVDETAKPASRPDC